MIECASWHAVAYVGDEWAERRTQWVGTTAGRRDKSGSPLEPQAIGMAWVRACRSVGARAAPDAFVNEFKNVFGTVRRSAFLEPLP